MDDLKEQIALLEGTANLNASIDGVQKAIDLLTAARAKVAAEPQTAPLTLAKLHDPLKKTMESTQKDLLPMYKTLGKYSKALDKKFKDKPLPTAENDALSSHPSLINRAIAMHLLREGQFSVASTFVAEATDHPPNAEYPGTPNPYIHGGRDLLAFKPEELELHFTQMYFILTELRQNRNLHPAIQWAKERSDVLEARGSNLEFELCQLRFISLFTERDMPENDMGGETLSAAHGGGRQYVEEEEDVGPGPRRAWAYARSAFGPFQRKYANEVQQLMGAMAFASNIYDSPYRRYFYNDSAWEDVATSFTREFCSLLGLSADSPLYIAATAGAIALPTLLKLQNIMKEKRTEWTTQNELPVEIPLPPSYHFHSIFVCPVSKEQSTDENPPMMMPCGHVIAKESLERLSRGSRFKCPYCPNESHWREAKKVVL